MAQDINFGYVHGIIIERVVLNSATFFLPITEGWLVFKVLIFNKLTCFTY